MSPRQLGVDGGGVVLENAEDRRERPGPDGVKAGPRVRQEHAQDLRGQGGGGAPRW